MAEMLALAMAAFGGPEVLAPTTVPRPEPGADEVLIRVATVGANRQDLYTLAGRANNQPRDLPQIPGNDPAGVVVALGPGAAGPELGQRVVVKPSIACLECEACLGGDEAACQRLTSVGVQRPGGFAEYVVAPARNVFPIPAGLSFAEATALAQSAPIALHMLLDRAALRPDDTVLITGAAGAIGSAAVQVAADSGATVIAAARGPERADYVRSLGIADVIDYEAQPEFGPLVREIAPGGVSLYVESAGDPRIWAEATTTLARRGRIAVCGSHAGPRVELDLNWLFRNRVTIIGSSGSTSERFREALARAAEGRLRAPIDSVIPLVEARSAFERILARGNRGKVVLRVADDDVVASAAGPADR